MSTTPTIQWKKTIGIVLVVTTMLLGIALLWWRPLLLAPPNYHYSWLAYTLLAFAWIPVLIFCAFTFLKGARWIPIILAALRLAPVFLAAFYFLFGLAFFGERLPECKQIDAASDQTAYLCNVQGWDEPIKLEGPKGSPFVHEVPY